MSATAYTCCCENVEMKKTNFHTDEKWKASCIVPLELVSSSPPPPFFFFVFIMSLSRCCSSFLALNPQKRLIQAGQEKWHNHQRRKGIFFFLTSSFIVSLSLGFHYITPPSPTTFSSFVFVNMSWESRRFVWKGGGVDHFPGRGLQLWKSFALSWQRVENFRLRRSAGCLTKRMGGVKKGMMKFFGKSHRTTVVLDDRSHRKRVFIFL